MTRRSFFSVVAGFCASLGLPLPKAQARTATCPTDLKLSGAWVPVHRANESRLEYVRSLAKREVLRKRYPYPIIYDGDLLDPRYKLAGMYPPPQTRTGKLFVNGVDRTHEAYEAYCDENGWANLYIRDAEGRTVRIDGDKFHYSVRGKVEWVEKSPINELLENFVKAHALPPGNS